MEQARASLPVCPLRNELLAAIKEHPVLVVVGETGSGKTTQIPQYIIEEYPSDFHVVVTQPRRIAATSVAQRVAQEQSVRLGEARVGYTVRFDDRSRDDTQLRYVTDGVLLREATDDATLSRYSMVVVDEAHERSLDTDVLLGLLRRARRARPDLRILVMSATLNVEKFSDYFDACPIFSIPGRVYPVDVLHHTAARLNALRSCYAQRVLDTAMHVHRTEPPGDMLIFLTGRLEIERMCRDLHAACAVDSEDSSDSAPLEMDIHPLYAAMDSYDQGSIFAPAPRGQRKIIVATNIAQTSVTIPGIRYVVDSGFVKQKQYDPRVGMDALLVVPISQAAAVQRAGRAGRTQGGRCYRIYSREAFDQMAPETVPEIQRSNLLGVVLHMKRLGIDRLLEFEFLDRPERRLLVHALVQLRRLGALDADGRLTPLGRDMAALPVSPYLARALVAAARDFGCSEELVILAALLSADGAGVQRQPRREEDQEAAAEAHRRFRHSSGDHCTLIQLYLAWQAAGYRSEWCRRHWLRTSAMQSARNIRDQLRDCMKRAQLPLTWIDSTTRDKMPAIGKSEPILRAIVAAYSGHVAKRRNAWSPCYYHYQPQQEQTSASGDGDEGTTGPLALYVAPTSVLASDSSTQRGRHHLAHLDWLVFHSVTLGGQATMSVCSLIEPDWLPATPTAIDLDRLLGLPSRAAAAPVEMLAVDSASAPPSPTPSTLKRQQEQQQQQRDEAVAAARARYQQRKKARS